MTTTFPAIPTLTTDRLVLRAPSINDFGAECAFYSSDRAEFVGGQAGPEQVWRMIASFLGHWSIRGFGFWGIEDRNTGAYLGRAGLWFPHGWPEPEIGWTLMETAEGKGIAYEAACAARDHAYETLGWTTAISLIAPENARSIALAERMGATLDYEWDHERFGRTLVYRHPAPEVLQ